MLFETRIHEGAIRAIFKRDRQVNCARYHHAPLPLSDDELIRMFIWDNGGGEPFLLVKETQYEEESLR
ncbi:hypothetical protein Hdeb2414_s0193g00828851 [Helianthus debilis subsp. tardiflorus]